MPTKPWANSSSRERLRKSPRAIFLSAIDPNLLQVGQLGLALTVGRLLDPEEDDHCQYQTQGAGYKENTAPAENPAEQRGCQQTDHVTHRLAELEYAINLAAHVGGKIVRNQAEYARITQLSMPVEAWVTRKAE